MTPVDTITLSGVRAFAFHGVLPAERRDGQFFVVDVVVHRDLSAAAASDDLSKTVNYAVLAEQVVAVVESEPVDLLETVAERVAQMVLSHDGVQRTVVTVHKPGAPISVPFADVAVTITRFAPDPPPTTGGVE
ncbi:MAG: dihydroneopterin aldolase [Rhodoglobus sp.]